MATGTGGFAFLVAGLMPWRVAPSDAGTSLPLMMLEKDLKSILEEPFEWPFVSEVAEGAIF